MAEPSELIVVARMLASGPAPSGAQLRRAVSTAYYALFHKVLRAAADRFVGHAVNASAGYAIVYRSFDHRHMNDVCDSLNVSTLGRKLRKNLGRTVVSREMRDFAGAFVQLQAARHLADYHPTMGFTSAETAALIGGAVAAMEAFDRAPEPERADVLALLMLKLRD